MNADTQSASHVAPASRPTGIAGRLRRIVNEGFGTHRGLIRTMLGQAEYLLGRLEPHVHVAPASVNRLVFVCLGNINRSAFAESLAHSLGAVSCSIGLATTTGKPAFHMAIATATLFDLDLTSHRATAIDDYRFQANDLLLAMEIRHVRQLVSAGFPKERIVLLGNWAAPHRIHLHDPHTLSDAYFRTCFSLIHSAVTGFVGEMRAAQSPCMRHERIPEL